LVQPLDNFFRTGSAEYSDKIELSQPSYKANAYFPVSPRAAPRHDPCPNHEPFLMS
jgi:hypothetical protein